MRNYSINKYFADMGKNHQPKWRFTGSTKKEWLQWRENLLPALKASLGTMPTRVPLNPETLCEWSEDGICKRKVVIDVEEGLAADLLFYWPENVTGKIPGILACHGHGPFGKEMVMGNRSTPELQAYIKEHNYDYGLQMAKAGFAVVSLDWRGFGIRDDRNWPICSDTIHAKDICNVNYVRATIMGMTILGMDINDGMCALDYLCSHDFVDADHLGVMGMSFGGTMTAWMSLYDQRIKAADIICYSDRFEGFLMRDCYGCGSQITPGLFLLCDVPDLHGLSAPKPLLVESGIQDECFRIAAALDCYREVEKIYAAAGVSENLELDMFDGPHAWGGNKSVEFFREHLKGA